MISSFLVKAADITIKPGEGFSNLGSDAFNVPNLISWVIRLTLVVAAVLFFIMLVIGGIRWIVSGGDKGQTEAARSQITAALVGLVIVFAAWAIAALIQTFFGVSIINLSLPTVTRP